MLLKKYSKQIWVLFINKLYKNIIAYMLWEKSEESIV